MKTKFKDDCFGHKEEVSKTDYCQWCWDMNTDEKRKKVPVFACVPFGQSWWTSPMTVCRNCLCSIVSNEIEMIRTEEDGIVSEIDNTWKIPIEIEVIKSIAFEGLE